MKTRYLIITFLGISLSACVTTGYISLENAAPELIARHIEPGITTKTMIIRCFGNNASVSFNSSGKEVWVYHINRSVLQVKNDDYKTDTNLSIKKLAITFDQKGVVSQYSTK